MKLQILFRFIAFLFLLALFYDARSQVSFLQPDTAVWRFRGFVYPGVCLYYDWQYMLTNQDTIVGIHAYRKIYQLGDVGVIQDCNEPLLGSLSPAPAPLLAYLIREEGRKVYLWPVSPYNESEYLAFDFDQQVGDTIPLYLPSIVTIDSIEEIVFNGKTFKQYSINYNELFFDTIIEGIGIIGFFPFLNYFEISTTIRLICYSRNDSVFFQRYDSCGFFEYPPGVTSLDNGSNPKIIDPHIVQLIYPNPATNQVNIIFKDVGDYSVEIYDLIGRLHQVDFILNEKEIQTDLSSLQAGIYLLHIKHKGNLISIEKLGVN